VQVITPRPGLIPGPQHRPIREPAHQPPDRLLLVEDPVRGRLSSSGNSVATTIVFFEVSIPRWISPVGAATLDMTAGSLPP
jgi:hypothetical protein